MIYQVNLHEHARVEVWAMGPDDRIDLHLVGGINRMAVVLNLGRAEQVRQALLDAICEVSARTKPERALENVCACCGPVRVNPNGGVHGGACAGCLHSSGKHSWEQPAQSKPEKT